MFCFVFSLHRIYSLTLFPQIQIANHASNKGKMAGGCHIGTHLRGKGHELIDIQIVFAATLELIIWQNKDLFCLLFILQNCCVGLSPDHAIAVIFHFIWGSIRSYFKCKVSKFISINIFTMHRRVLSYQNWCTFQLVWCWLSFIQ